MTIELTDRYRKDFGRLPTNIQKKTAQQMKRLSLDLRHPGVKARKMVGQDDMWEGRVDGSYRFTFKIIENTLLFRRVGTHAIYKKP